jgi:hypothetical protein
MNRLIFLLLFGTLVTPARARPGDTPGTYVR